LGNNYLNKLIKGVAEMNVLVTYMSQTGNTRKVAEEIFAGIDEEKEIKPIDEVDSIADYDVSFLGFPIHQEGPDKKTTQLLEKHCVNGRKVVLFITHASPEDGVDLPPMLAKFRQAARGADLVDMFHCQGQLAKAVKFILSVYPKAKYRRWAREDNSPGQPDQARLDRARAFSREVMQRLKNSPTNVRHESVAAGVR
jgi:flavodoxin